MKRLLAVLMSTSMVWAQGIPMGSLPLPYTPAAPAGGTAPLVSDGYSFPNTHGGWIPDGKAFDSTGATAIIALIADTQACVPADAVAGQSNTWVMDYSHRVGTVYLRFWHTFPTHTGSGHKLKVDDGGGGSGICQAAITWQVWDTYTAIDSGVYHNAESGTSATSLASGSVTPSSGGKRLLISAWSQTLYPTSPGEIATSATSVDSGFTITANLAGVSSTSQALAMAYLVESTGGVAKNPAWTFPNTGGSGYATVSVAGYK